MFSGSSGVVVLFSGSSGVVVLCFPGVVGLWCYVFRK